MDNRFYKSTLARRLCRRANPALMYDLRSKALRARLALSPVALVAAGLLQQAPAWAQGEPEPGLRLAPSPMLREQIPSETREQLPTFVRGDSIRGQVDQQTEIEGNAELRRGDTILRADRLQYDQTTDLARASGNVHINKAGTLFDGSLLELKVDAFEGFFNEPRYRFLQNDAYGEADRVDFIDDQRSVIHNATYTTCQRKPGPSWMPDWILRASTLRIDRETEIGHAEDATLSFMGMPLVPVPAMSFPLSDNRKSGLLPPTFGLDNVSGLELTLPYYWNIAPNRDATFYPTLMTKRGIDFGAEVRYLEPTYAGTWQANVLPNDRLRDRHRWGYGVKHDQFLPLPVIGGLGLNLNVNRVSDDDYWRDFPRSGPSLTQRLLAGEGGLTWAAGPLYLNARATKWQTLQDVTAPITPPYDRAPQLVARYTRTELPGGIDASIEADYTRFSVDGTLNGQPNARRGFTHAQVSRVWQAPGWFFTPRVQLHARHYEFDSPLPGTGASTASVVVPTASLDGGLVFERDTELFGRALRQTLEPRAFYVYTPFRDQNALPNYDSGYNDFNFATIWTENAFGGHDRISDNNLLTLGLTTRLLDPDTGAEAARFGVAQRLRFKDQRVTLPGGAPVSERLSDILFGASVNWVPKWTVDATIQYNPKDSRSVRSTIGGRYNPGNYRVISAAYRLQRNSSEQIDVGWQWPLNDLWGDRGANLGPGMGEGEGRWYSVGRINYSMRDRRVVDAVVGLEYDGGCWLGRIVFERLQAGTTQSTKRVLFQLEFLGLTRLGANALQSLKDNIPRYQFLREQVTTPSRFSNYD